MYNYSGYNPAQSRIDMLNQQKQMLDNQIQSLQQMSGIPPIHINNNMGTPQNNQSNYDGNFKWVDGEEQAKQIANNNLPLILFDNNSPMFYMKNINGSFKKFKFQEVIEEPVTSNNEMLEGRMNSLENKLNTILNVLGSQSPTSNENTKEIEKSSQTSSKPSSKGGTK